MIKYKYKITKQTEVGYSVEGVGGVLELPDFVTDDIILALVESELKEEQGEFKFTTDKYTFQFTKIKL